MEIDGVSCVTRGIACFIDFTCHSGGHHSKISRGSRLADSVDLCIGVDLQSTFVRWDRPLGSERLSTASQWSLAENWLSARANEKLENILFVGPFRRESQHWCCFHQAFQDRVLLVLSSSKKMGCVRACATLHKVVMD